MSEPERVYKVTEQRRAEYLRLNRERALINAREAQMLNEDALALGVPSDRWGFDRDAGEFVPPFVPASPPKPPEPPA